MKENIVRRVHLVLGERGWLGANYIEQPGFIEIPVGGDENSAPYWAFGTAAETWGGDFCAADGDVFFSVDLAIPSSSDDAETIATTIEAVVDRHGDNPVAVHYS